MNEILHEIFQHEQIIFHTELPREGRTRKSILVVFLSFLSAFGIALYCAKKKESDATVAIIENKTNQSMANQNNLLLPNHPCSLVQYQ